MSRNFELLSQVGRMQDILQRPADARPITEEPVAEPFVPAISVGINGVAGEEVLKLVRNLFFVPAENAPRRVVFTGAEEGTGCSWICAHVAKMLAGQGPSTICVVDCNLHTPSLHEYFNLPNQLGLTDALQSAHPVREYVRCVAGSNLWLLTAGSGSDGQPTTFASENMRSVLNQLFGQFDYVLLDSASLNFTNDAVALGGAADGIVLVLREQSSRRETARKHLQDLRTAKVPALGVVLNQRTFPIPEAIYKLF